MKEKNNNSSQENNYNNNLDIEIKKQKTFIGLPFNKEKNKDLRKSLKSTKESMKSDSKIINFSEMIPKLLETIKSKNSSRHNIYLDTLNNSFGIDSNSSELNDESDENNNIIHKKCSIKIPSKIPKLNLENNKNINEYKNLEPPNTYREQRKYENSPCFNNNNYLKENKESFILTLNKYFFQDGDLENIDTLIKYNINKIKINNDVSPNLSFNFNNNFNDNNNVFDYFNIKRKVINLMNKFANAFDDDNKDLLIIALQGLKDFSEKYKFDYVTNLTLEWLDKLKDKKYYNCEIKYIGYYNQIRDIMDKMLKELKKKADYIIITNLKKNKYIRNDNNIYKNNIINENNINKNNIINENKINTNNNNNNNNVVNESSKIIVNKTLKKTVSLNKDDLLRTKEIVPIKIDIEVQNTLNINDVENNLKSLEEGDLANLGSKVNLPNNNNNRLINKPKNRNENELEAFSYPFKDDSICICYIF